MDVLRRHRLLVLGGFALALALAMLSYVRVSADGLSYRKPEIWSNEATLVLSDESHPELRSRLSPTADPSRFTGLVDQYATFATSDDVIRSLRQQRLLPRSGENRIGAITATVVPSSINGAPTPLLKITGTAGSPAEATRLTVRATDTFIAFAKARQVEAKIPKSQRVELRIVNRTIVPKLTGPRSKTMFIIVLLAGLTATVAAAFLRENLQSAKKAEDVPEPVSVLDPPVREVATPPSAMSEPIRTAAEQVARSGVNEFDDGAAEGGSVTHTRWSNRSSG